MDKWITNEKENINKTKKEIEKTWVTLADTVKRTKRDFMFMQKIVHTDANFESEDVSLKNSESVSSLCSIKQVDSPIGSY